MAVGAFEADVTTRCPGIAAVCAPGAPPGRVLADGRTALSEHRRRPPDKRSHRRVGVFMITSMAAILAITGGAYAALRGQSPGSDPVAAAAADLPVGTPARCWCRPAST